MPARNNQGVRLRCSAVPSEKRARQRAGRATRVAELQRAQRRRRRLTRVLPAVAVAIIVALIGIFLTSGGSSKKKVSTSTSTTAKSTTSTSTTPVTAAPVTGGTSITGTTPCPKIPGPNPHVLHFAKAPPNCLTPGKTYTGTIVTNMGTVDVTFDTTKTPMTANNFIVLSAYHYFDGTSIFRIATSIGIIQGGSPHTQNNSDPGPGYTIPDEGSGYTYAAGDLVMARTSAPNSAGAQYFFCVTNACSGLNSQGTYVVFAHVTSGLNVLQNILNLNTGSDGPPSKLVLVNSITISES
jgi:peptidyl-prolyl cis-trans isomerase B (cyclophilin B)